MFSKILLTVDGSEQSRKAAEYALELARNCKSSILLVHVVNLASFSNVIAVPSETAKHLHGKLMEEARGLLDTKEELCRQHEISCEKVIRIGNPASEIIKVAEESGASLIVMGSKGRTALSGAVFGSVCYGVLHKDKNIPVFVVKA